jgi:hypothetical protein
MYDLCVQISKLEWFIFDAMADGYESVSGIWQYVTGFISEVTDNELKNTIYNLYHHGLILVDGKTKRLSKIDILHEEISKESLIGNCYFGMTTKGAYAWEEASSQYGEIIDWSDSTVSNLEYKTQRGYVEGISIQICLRKLGELILDNNWQIDMNSIIHSEIDGFRPKYYKYIPGGYRICFTLKKTHLDTDTTTK